MRSLEDILVEEAKKSRTNPISIRLTNEQLDYVQKLADKTGVSLTKVFQTMVETHMKGDQNA